ncbi:hypothetical protein [Desulfospira joergensenii]|uniref:hypothetical protein n=1 Tax=Desulfospira joergensenii TaxID=53329 RepID=UPI0012946924|nr:hypothetical protein [Desulfospira joergensenii]
MKVLKNTYLYKTPPGFCVNTHICGFQDTDASGALKKADPPSQNPLKSHNNSTCSQFKILNFGFGTNPALKINIRKKTFIIVNLWRNQHDSRP